ncbi:MAG: hypothetical protein P8L18_16965 [Verrucomicrobiota bacterium]|nr:hypothetical protein [Verrucomicrobiota bacterium]
MDTEYHPSFSLPKMFRMEQVHEGKDSSFDHVMGVEKALIPIRHRVVPGMRVGIAVGSRGIAGLQSMVAATVRILLELGAKPVILPAMGSHGGATSEGQVAVLDGYGINVKALGVPVEPSMDTLVIGVTEWDTPVHWSRVASGLDGVLVINRVKPHTDFKGSLGSGILKMLVVGLGKRDGASAFHRASIQFGYEKVLRDSARLLLSQMPVLGGLAIVENAYHQTQELAFVPSESAVEAEEALFKKAHRLMPSLPFDDLDLLIVDRIGKNISGSGMDPNVIGRGVHGYSTNFGEQTESPHIKRIVVRDLTPESRGNAIGIGMADFTTARLVNAMQNRTSFVNAVTAMTMNGAKVPVHFETDQEVIQWALSSLVIKDTRQARVLRIRDTLNLERMQASESLLRETTCRERIKVLGEPLEMIFDQLGCLPCI